MKSTVQTTKWLLATALIVPAILLNFVACGSNSSSSAAVPVPATATGINPLDPDNCAVGQIDAPGYGCLAQGSCQVGQGYASTATPPQCVTGTEITQAMISGTVAAGATTYIGTMSISNQQEFQTLMQYAGLCNPYWSGENYGSWSCATWTQQGGFVELQFANTIAAVGSTASGVMIVGAGSIYGSEVSGSSQPYISFTSQASAVLYNNSQGMQIIATLNGQDQGLRLVINTGTIGQTSAMAGTLTYQGTTIGTVNLVPQE